MEVRDILQEAGIKTIPNKEKCKEAKWLSKEALKISKFKKKKKKKKKTEREKWKAKEKTKDISIWMQSSKE